MDGFRFSRQINLEKNFKLLGVIDKNKKISETEYLGNDNDFMDELDSSFCAD